MRRSVSRAVLGAAAALAACAFLSPGDDYQYRYRIPERTGDGWETASASEMGLDEGRLERLMGDLHDIGDHEVHGIVVVRHGRLVFEHYFPGRRFALARYTGDSGFTREDTHCLQSVTKSVTTTLFGIALDRAAVGSVQQAVFDYFPEHAGLVAADPRRAALTLEHLLTMQAPISWNDEVVRYSDPSNDLSRMFSVADPIGYALSRDLYATPGTLFDYCNAATNILGDVVRRATGQRLDQFADAALFQPLGITTRRWYRFTEDVVFASGDLELRPRDAAKIGQLFLNRGTWNGHRVVSADWVDRATSRIVRPGAEHSWADWYGYGWWHRDLVAGRRTWPAYMASGWGGQWIVVVPSADLVFVATGGNYFRAEPMSARRMLESYVLPVRD